MSAPKGTDTRKVTIHLPAPAHAAIQALCAEHERQHPGARFAVSAWVTQLVLREVPPAPAEPEPAKGKRRAA